MFQHDFSLDEFKSRRSQVCDAIGDALAIVAGAPASDGSMKFRQYNDFYYLCGVEVPHSYLLIDGATGKTTLFLPEAKLLVCDDDDPMICADDPEYAVKTTGVDAAFGRDMLIDHLQDAKTIYTFIRNGEGLRACVRSLRDARTQVEADPWDAQPDRGSHFCDLLKERVPGVEILDLADIVYEMRMVKSPKEIELCRKAGKMSAIALVEAMRATRPGVMEYELAATMQYVYLAGGSLDCSYPPIVGGGKNGYHGHYHVNHSPLNDGDMVLVDCAPDYRYYTSDITRMWPVNGKYTPAQRALYGYITEYQKTLLTLIKPGKTCDQIENEAIEIMKGRVGEFDFATDAHAKGPEFMFNFPPGHLAHSVGLSVHDGLSHKEQPLKPGMIFAVDPQMKIPEDRLYLRVEDTVVVTEDGVEVLTRDVPWELDELEALMTGDGMIQQFPPVK